MLYLLFNRLILLVLSLLLFFFFTLFTSLCSRSFLALVSAIFVVTCSARSGITSTELQLFEPGVDAYQYLRPREVYPGQMVDDPCNNILKRAGYKSKLFLFFFETAFESLCPDILYLAPPVGDPSVKKSTVRFKSFSQCTVCNSYIWIWICKKKFKMKSVRTINQYYHCSAHLNI